MRKILLFAFVALIAINTFGQVKLKLKTEKHKNPWFTEKYYVLKSNPNIKQGEYKKFGYQDCLMEHGYFINNQKDSTWITYRWRSDKLESKGSYKNDKKTGVWDYHDYQGRLEYRFDYEQTTVIEYNWHGKSDSINVKLDGEWKKRKVDSPPICVGDEYLHDIAKNLRYPETSSENGISGRVFIAIAVNKLGEVTNYRVEKSVDDALDKEALRVVKGLKINWIPAYIKNQPVEAEKLIPIVFALQ